MHHRHWDLILPNQEAAILAEREERTEINTATYEISERIGTIVLLNLLQLDAMTTQRGRRERRKEGERCGDVK
jgi:hypothetical protein